MRQLAELWNHLQELARACRCWALPCGRWGDSGASIAKTVTRWTANDGNLLAASMAYYAAFSFYPLLWVLMAVLGYGLRFSDRAARSPPGTVGLSRQEHVARSGR